jgi:DNA replication protein DnaC
MSIANQNELPPPDIKLEQQLQRLEDQVRQREEKAHQERLAFMAKQPQSMPCPKHPDCIQAIDENATEEASRYHIYDGHGYVAGYARCPKCVEDAQNQKLKKLGVPENLIRARFENFTPDSEVEANHIEVVKEFCNKRTGFLFLCGNFGTGKTHLAVAGLRTFGTGWLVKQASLLRALRDTYADKSAFDPIERAQNARLLVLDDVGLSGGGRDELPMLHEILDYRHGSRLPTIITSNLPFENLSAVLGERMADRLRESTFRVLTFTGSSHRRDARELYFDASPAKPPSMPVKNCFMP